MLNLVSFVGVDEKTDLDELVKTALVFEDEKWAKGVPLPSAPVIEFGFLYSESKSKTGDPRYPSMDFIREALDYLWDKNEVYFSTSVHLCGEETINKFMDYDTDIHELVWGSRTQLNLNIHKIKDTFVTDLLDMIYNDGLANLNRSIILQHNKSKKDLNARLLKEMELRDLTEGLGAWGNIDILHDGSGGFGREIESVEKPFDLFYTGYAGGLRPGNIGKILGLIEAVNPDHHQFYIDMESGVRTDNLLSLEKCSLVLDEVVDFYKNFEIHDDFVNEVEY
jgi:hypothetical protein